MDVENRQVFFKTFESQAEQKLITKLENEWVCFDEISKHLVITRCQAERWIDALTLRCPLAEKNEGRFVFFKIITEQDFTKSCKTKQ
jgi:hypothetical protein